MVDRSPETRWRWVARAAIAAYCLFAALLIAQNPGFQYDEALLVLGGVHMRISPQQLTLPHDPDTWYCGLGRCLQFMTVRYVGAVKDYLSLPLFALFGPSAEIVRLLSALLGAVGIWGIARLIGEHAGRPEAAMIALALAIHPAYADLTVFDNGTVSVWMAAVGLLSAALSRFLRLRNGRSAFWVGVAMGFGIWARANFLWFLTAALLASAVVFRKRLLEFAAHWKSIAGGGLVGGFPFVFYQAYSQGGTWQALGMFTAQDTLPQRLYNRWFMLSEVLLSDREHRAMWQGPPMPDWQRWLFPAIVLASCVVCWAVRDARDEQKTLWARGVSLAFLCLAAIFLLATMPVSEHHLITLLPLAALTVVFACRLIWLRFRWGKWAVVLVAALYAGSAGYWQASAIRGLAKTGGVGQWSDAIYPLAEHIQQAYPDCEVRILDWGLQTNLYVLSDGKIRSREIFWDATAERTGFGRPWQDEIRAGGVFLMNGPTNRQMPAATAAFEQALAAVRPEVKRFHVRQRNGAVYAEIIEIPPVR